MKTIHDWLNESAYLAPLSPACRMCAQGKKMVVLVTGLCSTNCFYCPLSFKKGGTDRIFADEWELDNDKDTQKLIREAEYIKAAGAGITGGDPLLVWQRVKTYITLLKDTFGSSFHIHLYTSALKQAQHLDDLYAAGLDEIRFHPLPATWNNMDASPLKTIIQNAVENTPDVAIEIPVLPQSENDIMSLVTWANEQGVRWVNLNELEFSERNCDAFNARGYLVKNDISAGVKGSQETALSVLRQVQEKELGVGVHYCSVSFKDGVQLTNRIKRRAKSIARKYDVITDEGTLVKGVVYSKTSSLTSLVSLLKQTYHVPTHLYSLDTENNRLEIAPGVLEQLAPGLTKKGYLCYIIEEYPTADRLEVERIPLS